MVIITDGEASDGDLLEAMKPLDDLPALIVVKLCTDEQKVVDYWYYSPGLAFIDHRVSYYFCSKMFY